MCIEKLEVTGIVYHSAHEVAGLFVMEKGKVKTLELIIQTAS